MTLAPIAIPAYNRPDHLRKVIDALSKNTLAKESDLFIFSDAPLSDKVSDKVSEVRNMPVKGFKSVNRINNIVNVGASASIIDAVTRTLFMYDSVIVLEDDLITSPNFLIYMNRCLDLFKDRKDISSISGYNMIPATDLYLSYRPCSWGWATWSDRWDAFDPNNQKITKKDKRGFNRGGDDLYRMYKQIDVWDVKWAFHNYKHSLYTVYPDISKVKNIGSDGSGIHVENRNLSVELDTNSDFTYDDKNIQPSKEMLDKFKSFYHHSLYKKFKLLIYDFYRYVSQIKESY